MKKLLLGLSLLAPVAALAQTSSPAIPLREAVRNFPRSELQLKARGPVSIDTSKGPRASYEALAELAGLNIIIDRDFGYQNFNEPLRIDNLDVLDAFDLVSANSGSFVEVVDANTIIVARDNQTKHRDYDLQVF